MELHPVFTAPWHSPRHATVPCGGHKRRLCLHCASAYLAAAVPSSNIGRSRQEHPHPAQQLQLQLLELLLALPPLPPHSAAASTLPTLLPSWLYFVLQSGGGSCGGDGMTLAARIRLAAAGLVRQQVTALTLRPHPSLLAEFFTAAARDLSRPLLACMSKCLANPVLARAASRHRSFTRALLALPELGAPALAVSHSILELSDDSADNVFAHDFLDSLFGQAKLGP